MTAQPGCPCALCMTRYDATRMSVLLDRAKRLLKNCDFLHESTDWQSDRRKWLREVEPDA